MFELSNSEMITLLAILLVGSTFFSGSETALLSLDRYRLRVKIKEGLRSARLVEKLLERKDRLLGVILVGNNITNIGASVLATLLSQRYAGLEGPLYATVLLTLYILIFAEIAPKTLAALKPELLAYPASWMLYFLRWILYPVILVLNFCSNAVIGLFGVHPHRHKPDHSITRSELLSILDEDQVGLPSEYIEVLTNLVRLDEIQVDDIMVPRGEVIGLDIQEVSSDTLIEAFAKKRITRVPVYEGELDKIIGVLDARDAVTAVHKGGGKSQLKNFLRQPYFVPEGTALPTQLLNFQHLKQNMGIVVDEYGAVQGIITLQGILSEIIGKVRMGYLGHSRTIPKHKGISRQKDGSYIINGNVSLRYIKQLTGWSLDAAESVSTLNGLVLEKLGSLPDRRVSINAGECIIEVLSIHKNNLIRQARLRSLNNQVDEINGSGKST